MSSNLPERRLHSADTKQYKVKASQTVRAGFPVVLSSTASTDANYQEIDEVSADTDVPIGIAQGKPGTTFTAGQTVDVTHLFSVVEQVLVGTGGATRGLRATAVSDGLTDAPAHGTNTRIYSPGIFLETGVVGDIVSLGVCPLALSKA